MPVKKLYFIFFRSDAASARDIESELDGVIWLTEAEAKQLEKRGYAIMSSDGGEFDLHPVTPYEYNDAANELRQWDNEPDILDAFEKDELP